MTSKMRRLRIDVNRGFGDSLVAGFLSFLLTLQQTKDNLSGSSSRFVCDALMDSPLVHCGQTGGGANRSTSLLNQYQPFAPSRRTGLRPAAPTEPEESSMACRACLIPEDRCIRVRFPPTLCCVCLREQVVLAKRTTGDEITLCSEACKSRWPLRLQRIRHSGSTSPLLSPGSPTWPMASPNLAQPQPSPHQTTNSANSANSANSGNSANNNVPHHYSPSSSSSNSLNGRQSPATSAFSGTFSEPTGTPPPAYTSPSPTPSNSQSMHIRGPPPPPPNRRPPRPPPNRSQQELPATRPPIPARYTPHSPRLDPRVERLMRMGFEASLVQAAIEMLGAGGEVTEEMLVNHLVAEEVEPPSPTTSLVRQVTDLGFQETQVRSTLNRLTSVSSGQISAEEIVEELVNQPAPSPRRTSSVSDDGSKECAVCMSNVPDSVIVPCGHVCLCHDCGEALLELDGTRKTCPICRGPINSVVKLFYT